MRIGLSMPQAPFHEAVYRETSGLIPVPVQGLDLSIALLYRSTIDPANSLLTSPLPIAINSATSLGMSLNGLPWG